MTRKKKHFPITRLLVSFVALVLAGCAAAWYFSGVSIPVLQPAGPVAQGQKDLLVYAFLLMLVIVVPVFVLTFGIAWRYRETNTKATYKPNWDKNNVLEAIWWGVPTILIAVLAVMTWHGTFRLDPYKPLASENPSMTVQVIALDWRWLFIYPEQNVASVNELYIPVDRPIKFEMTADAPMNSFWIPSLGGQVYVMPGMGTILYLEADKIGEYYGSGANISGKGFADMNFTTYAVSADSFEAWAKRKSSSPVLTIERYEQLAKPQIDNRILSFSNPDTNLYSHSIHKYMKMNSHSGHGSGTMDHNDHSGHDHSSHTHDMEEM